MKTMAAIFLSASIAFAQAPANDFAHMTMKVEKLAPNFYTITGINGTGRTGGAIGVLTGPDGNFMVDATFAPLADKVEAAIKTFSNGPVRFLVNTHPHGDHTGGNAHFAKTGTVIMAKTQLRAAMAAQKNVDPASLPIETYNTPVTLHMNGEEIVVIPVPPSHTDGDTMVYFPGLNIIMTGDFYRAVQYPNVDRANGGSVQGLIDGLGTVIGHAGPNTKIIPGHGPTVDRLAVIAHRDIALTVRDRVAALLAQGKSEDEVVAAKVTADLDSKIQQPGTTSERFVRQVYADLKATR